VNRRLIDRATPPPRSPRPSPTPALGTIAYGLAQSPVRAYQRPEIRWGSARSRLPTAECNSFTRDFVGSPQRQRGRRTPALEQPSLTHDWRLEITARNAPSLTGVVTDRQRSAYNIRHHAACDRFGTITRCPKTLIQPSSPRLWGADFKFEAAQALRKPPQRFRSRPKNSI